MVFTDINSEDRLVQGMFAAQPEVSDMQQRLRIAVETLQKDLLMAGAGTYSGNNKLGSLGNYVATILPDREGNVSPDPPGTFKCTTTFCSSLAASDTITLMYVPPTSAQTTIRDAMPANSSELKVNAQSGCPSGDDLCGFKEGMQVMIFDDTGTSDVFSITNVQTSALHLQHKGTDLSKAYSQNTYITQIAAATYWLKTDTVAETYQLMRYDGYQTDAPIAENIVGMAFEYFAEPSPPVLIKSVTEPITTAYTRLKGAKRVSVTGKMRSTTGAPLAGARSGLPGVARMSGADPERPQCHTVPSPR